MSKREREIPEEPIWPKPEFLGMEDLINTEEGIQTVSQFLGEDENFGDQGDIAREIFGEPNNPTHVARLVESLKQIK